MRERSTNSREPDQEGRGGEHLSIQARIHEGSGSTANTPLIATFVPDDRIASENRQRMTSADKGTATSRTVLGVKGKILTVDLPHKLGAKFNCLLSSCSALRFKIAPASLRRAMLVMRQFTCVSSRSSFAFSIIRGQLVAQLLGGFVLVADHGDAVWRGCPTARGVERHDPRRAFGPNNRHEHVTRITDGGTN
jgi:hypothetical protein